MCGIRRALDVVAIRMIAEVVCCGLWDRAMGKAAWRVKGWERSWGGVGVEGMSPTVDSAGSVAR